MSQYKLGLVEFYNPQIHGSINTKLHTQFLYSLNIPVDEFINDHPNGWIDDMINRHHNVFNWRNINVVVVLVSGRPLLVTEELEKSTAFVAAWLPGSEGAGVAEVLFGKYDFHGKLPHSWPKSIHDFNGKYGPNYWNDSITPLFPLGYGLTYRSTDNCKK
jgi:hypothetical protein